ncbi:hypothetical protein HNR01_001800 [Methylorubrum rhodesianum]|uniref:hypothetical protein n=1 Tax=Methylorubrum rhodesianum TaxID=29427 RepID=UPI001617954D|nr:hypothetical protein [Methylorubrum rhodesianum]MBB5762180.1 hypothetical protein [Methylorubrum rhodesianum]
MKRFLAPLLALVALGAPALAQTRALPPGEIRANGDITFGNTLKLGRREGTSIGRAGYLATSWRPSLHGR